MLLRDAAHRGVAPHLHSSLAQVVLDEGREPCVEGAGQHLRQLLEDHDPQAAGGECLGHLEPDVPSAHDRRGRCPFLIAGRGECPGGPGVQGERVRHRVQHVSPVIVPERPRSGNPVDGWAHRARAGAEHEAVEGKLARGAAPDEGQRLGLEVDARDVVVQQQPHPGRLELRNRAVSQVLPLRHLA